jgi:uncharacterized repeat protein (TIGR02543 family)
MKKILLIALTGVLAIGIGTMTSCKPDPEIYTVTFNSEGGSAVSSQKVEEGNRATEPTDPTYEGYDFLGWFTSATEGTEWDFSKAVNSSMTLYAQWAANSGTVIRQDLEAKIAEFGEYVEADYTKASWAPFAEALADAKEAVANTAATEEELQAATEALVEAEAALVPIGEKGALETLIALADDQHEPDYTAETWATFTEALAAAHEVFDNADATTEEIEAAQTALQEALDNLVSVLDGGGDGTNIKDALEDAINAAEELPSYGYTDDSFQALLDALEEAKDILDDLTSTRKEIEDALLALVDALENLEEDNTGDNPGAADKSDLNARITYAGTLEEADYTPESWTAFETALAKAQAIAAKATASQAEINLSLNQLNEAISLLDHATVTDPDNDPGDNTALTARIASAEALVEDEYTAESWAELEEALAAAVAVSEDAEATQAEIDTALAALVAAIRALEPAEVEDPGTEPGDNAALTAGIEAAGELVEAEYSTESWTAFEAALAAAVAVSEDEEATQAEIDAALAKLNIAIAALEPAEIAAPEPGDKSAL